MRFCTLLITAKLLFWTNSVFAQRTSETDLGPMVAVTRQFSIDTKECEKKWKVQSSQWAECQIVVGEPRIARLLSAISQIANWQYDSGKGWRLRTQITLTSSGYTISIVGDGKTPSDRLQWPVAQKYILKTIEKLKAPSVSADYVRPANDIRQDEVLLGPVYVFERIIPLNPGTNLMNVCEDRIKSLPGRSVCQLSFVNSAKRDVSLVNRIEEYKSKNTTADSFKIEMNSTKGWTAGGSFSTSYLRLEYEGELKNFQTFKNYYAKTIKDNSLTDVRFTLHRIGDKPQRTLLYSERSLGAARLIYREFDIDVDQCFGSWQVSNGRARCHVNLPFRGIRLSENLFLFQKSVYYGSDAVYLNVSVDQTGYIVEGYGKDAVLLDLGKMRRILQEVMKNFPNGLFRDLAMVYPQP